MSAASLHEDDDDDEDDDSDSASGHDAAAASDAQSSSDAQEKLACLAKLLGVTVSYQDFSNKANRAECLSLVSLSFNPAQVRNLIAPRWLRAKASSKRNQEVICSITLNRK